jgi:hypothetical protein
MVGRSLAIFSRWAVFDFRSDLASRAATQQKARHER